MKTVLSAIDNLDQDDRATRTLVLVFYLCQYPALIFWTILGTVFFLNDNSEENFCVKYNL
jgi:hypothetical protein